MNFTIHSEESLLAQGLTPSEIKNMFKMWCAVQGVGWECRECDRWEYKTPPPDCVRCSGEEEK